MILARNVFQVKFGQMDKVLEVLKSAEEKGMRMEGVSRILTDISGPHFTLVVETKAESVNAHREALQENFENPELAEIMGSVMQLVESGHSEYYTIEYEA